MKTGMNLLLWTTHVTEKDFPTLPLLKKAGFDGVEVPIFEGQAPHFRRVRAELDNQGLECTTVTVATEDASPISPDPAIRQAALDRMKWAIEMTSILGGQVLCGPYYAPLGVFSGTSPSEEEKKRAADVLRQAADEAQKAGTKLAIEFLNRFECYFLTTARDAVDFVKRVNHPAFGMMFDTFHSHIEEKDPARALRDSAKHVIHVHISENDRGVPGSGNVRWPEIFKALREVGYDNWLVIEAFGRALPDLAAATKVWRDLFVRAEDVYTEGRRFIQTMWDQAA